MDSFSYFRSYYEALKDVKKPMTRLAIREAIDAYIFDGTEPVFSDSMASVIWKLLLPTLAKSKTYSDNRRGKTKANQNENKSTSNQEQNEIKSKSNSHQLHPIGKGIGKGLGEEKKDKEKSAEAATVARFIKPTLEQVQKYVAERGYHFDAVAFHAFYESKGWRVGNQPMKSWEAACVTWEKREPHPEVKQEQEEYHPITPLERCKVCGSKNVSSKGLYSMCHACGVNYVWHNKWQEEC